MESFLSDCREAFVISNCYGMGTPWLRSAGSKNREGVGLPAIASRSGEAGGLPPSIAV